LVTLVSADPPSRRRGRPYRFPEDTSPLTRVHGGVDHRVAWLLSASRIHAADPAMAHRDRFVAALKNIGVSADQARVSRWESGAQPVQEHVVAAYEQLLGIAPGHILAAVKGLRRSLSPEPNNNGATTTSPERLHEQLDKLFEQVDGDMPHGASWLELTSYLATHPQVYMRDKTWMQLAESLITEMGRSAGTAYIRRFEALRTLVRHRGAQRHIVKAIGAFVTDPAAQSVMHPLTLLQEVEHHRAGDLAMRLLTTDTGMLQQGAAWVTATKIPRGHYDDKSLRQLEAAVIMLLGSGSSLSDVDVLDVAARLPGDACKRILAALRDGALHARFDTLLRTGEILPSDITRDVAGRVADDAQTATPPPYRIEHDMMLQRLVREGLFHGHREQRHQAGVLLNASPYRAGVAAACAQAVDRYDDPAALQAAMLLRYVATGTERDVLLAWADDESRPHLRGHALTALGQLPGGVLPRDEAVVLQALETSGERPTRRACLYALGMAGAASLVDLANHDDEVVRRAAQWWSRTGPAIHESSTVSGQQG
jgi:hypothetical protein